MYWANFLHIYQPPTQTRQILDRVVNESYRKIIAGLLANPNAKLTLNINANLTEMLVNNGYRDVIDGLVKLTTSGQVELTGSAKFHPLLPKIPEREVVRQIRLNTETNRRYFGDVYNPEGFFPPEMGFSLEVGKVIADLGFKWVILDEMALPTKVDPTKVYQDRSGLLFFFRERAASFKILSAQLGTASVLIREFGQRVGRNEYLLTAMDGETFGHHRLGLEQLLLDIYKEPKLPTVTISELPRLFPNRITVEPRSATWALMDYELAKNRPFSRWDDSDNEIQQKQWELVRLAIDCVAKEEEVIGAGAMITVPARELLDKSLHSDQFWWASARPWWSLEMIERGARELLDAVEACTTAGLEVKQAAKDLYLGIITTGFDWQRSGRVENLSRKEDEEVRARMQSDKALVTREEYDKMIKILEKQMLAAAKNREYVRAELYRKRIAELVSERDEVPHEEEVDLSFNE